MVYAFKNAWLLFRQAPQTFFFFGVAAYAAAMLGTFFPYLAFLATYFVLPALYVGVAMVAEEGGYTGADAKQKLFSLGKGFLHAGTLGMLLLFQLIVGAMLLGFVVALFLDADTAATVESIQKEAANDPALLMELLSTEVDWVRSQFLGMALFLMALALVAFSLQSWFIRVFEAESFFGSIRGSIQRGRKNFPTWVAFTFLILLVFVGDFFTNGLLRLFSFPLLALTHYFLYKKMRS